MNGTEITLPQMLDCRERRNMVQDTLIDQYHKPVVSYCMNIPGPIKTNPQIRAAFESGLAQLQETLQEHGIPILEAHDIREVTGDEWIAAVDCDAEKVKDLAMQIEENHPLGRLFDMDVLGPDGRKLSRMRYRKCLICGRQAQECARSRTHTVKEMQDAIDVMLGNYFPHLFKGGIMSKSYRPVYHASVPSGWSNDPNGTIYYNGKAHLFFQHYPYNPAWGIMHWGHFTTKDLVHWEVLPIALRPDQDYEALCGCCSGSAIEKDGDLYLMYTAAQPDLQRQCLAKSEDGGVTFVKREDNPILTADMLDKEVSSYDFRDPRLFVKDGFYYFLAGARVIDLDADEEELAARTKKWDKLRASSSIRYAPSIFASVAQESASDGSLSGAAEEEQADSACSVSSKAQTSPVSDVFGQDPTVAGFGNLILCRSKDLLHWEYVGHLLHRQPQFEEDFYNLNGVYECPDYLVIDGQEIVLSSPQNLPQMDNRYQNVHSGLYLLGKLDFETGRYELEKIGELDNGFDFYAAQTLLMPDGRHILIAWKEMWDRNYPTQAEGWAGTYSFPRELSIDTDCLIQKPAQELDAFCQNGVVCDSFSVSDNEVQVKGVRGTVIRLRLTMEPGSAAKAGVKLFAGEKHETAVYYDREEGVLVIDRSRSGIKITGKEENVTVRKLDLGHPKSIELEMLLDVSSLEVFIDGGRHVMTANVYPDPEDTEVKFFAEGGRAVFRDIEKFDIVV